MKRFHLFMRAALVLSLGGGASASAQDGEQAIPCKEVPAAVTSSFSKTYPTATIKDCAREVEDGRTSYEISSSDGTTGRDVLYYEDGKLIVVEETIATGSLPEPVERAVHEKAPQGEITLAEKLIRDSSVTYELQVKHKGETIEMAFDPDGKELEP